MTTANAPISETEPVALTAIPDREREQEWQAGFEAMGRDPDTNSVEYTLPAAREVLFED